MREDYPAEYRKNIEEIFAIFYDAGSYRKETTGFSPWSIHLWVEIEKGFNLRFFIKNYKKEDNLVSRKINYRLIFNREIDFRAI